MIQVLEWGMLLIQTLKKITLEAEKLINSPNFKDKCKGSGEDVKVMTQRIDNNVSINLL